MHILLLGRDSHNSKSCQSSGNFGPHLEPWQANRFSDFAQMPYAVQGAASLVPCSFWNLWAKCTQAKHIQNHRPNEDWNPECSHSDKHVLEGFKTNAEWMIWLNLQLEMSLDVCFSTRDMSQCAEIVAHCQQLWTCRGNNVTSAWCLIYSAWCDVRHSRWFYGAISAVLWCDHDICAEPSITPATHRGTWRLLEIDLNSLNQWSQRLFYRHKCSTLTSFGIHTLHL